MKYYWFKPVTETCFNYYTDALWHTEPCTF